MADILFGGIQAVVDDAVKEDLVVAITHDVRDAVTDHAAAAEVQDGDAAKHGAAVAIDQQRFDFKTFESNDLRHDVRKAIHDGGFAAPVAAHLHHLGGA